MKKVLIIGAGRSGRGMLGELYDADQFNITFADINSNLIEGLRNQGYYTVQMKEIATGKCVERTIENYSVLDVSKEYDTYIATFAKFKYVSIAVMAEDFDSVSKAISDMIIYRKENNIKDTMYITLGANYVGLRKKFEELINEYLKDYKICPNDVNVHLLMSIVNRKNLLPENAENLQDHYRVIGDNKPVLRVDDDDLLREEKDLPSFFRLENNLDAAMAIKIWTGNVVQCSMAFVALQKNYEYTDEAANDNDSSRYAYFASKEAYEAVKQEYGLSERSEEESKYTVTIFRSTKFRDSLYRIARQPIRKFKKNDRFVGPALCCLKHGIVPYYITLCLAYGFLYRNPKEPDTILIEKYINEKGIQKAIIHFCELNLKNENERIVYELVLNHYYNITNYQPL